MILKFQDLLSPKRCCKGAYQEDEAPLIKVLPQLLQKAEEININALRCIYQLCNETNKENRVPMICNSHWDVLTPIIKCLCSDGEENGRHLACLIMANLSVPMENKAVLTLGNSSYSLFSALYTIIQQKHPEAYISCICLVNLSYLKEAQEPLFLFSPSASSHEKKSPLENSISACRIIENLIQTCIYPPIAATVQSEAVRWACTFLKNVSTTEKICTLIANTKIPLHIVGYLYFTKRPVTKWTKSSIEDSSLQIVLNLSQWEVSKNLLKKLKACEALRPIIGSGGIHDYRASAILMTLES